MAENSKIQWTENTWNPWQGCRKVSPGCKYCYMYRDREKFGQDPTIVKRSNPATFNKPLTRKKPAMVFTCSWSDWFIQEADEWRPEAWDIIRRTPHLTYQILTKRPERIADNLPPDWGAGYPNVWLSVSAEDQDTFNLRVPILTEILAAVQFLSLEPLLSKINFDHFFANGYLPDPLNKINWVIVGGESGNNFGKWVYRPCKIDWIESIVYDCKDLKIPVFVKQLGTDLARRYRLSDRHGGNIEEFPLPIRVRQFPNI